METLDAGLSKVLPGFEAQSQACGTWNAPVGEASWEIRPAGRRCWLVLSGDCESLGGESPWNWPIKASRRRPDAPLGWQADLELEGSDVRPVEAFVGQLTDSIIDAAKVKLPSDWPQRVNTALGGSLVETEGQERLTERFSRPIELADDGRGLELRIVLLQSRVDRQSTAFTAVSNLLEVANHIHTGCRAALTKEPGGAIVETVVSASLFKKASIRDGYRRLVKAASSLLGPCRLLVDETEPAAMYREFFSLQGAA